MKVHLNQLIISCMILVTGAMTVVIKLFISFLLFDSIFFSLFLLFSSAASFLSLLVFFFSSLFSILRLERISSSFFRTSLLSSAASGSTDLFGMTAALARKNLSSLTLTGPVSPKSSAVIFFLFKFKSSNFTLDSLKFFTQQFILFC